MTQNSTVFPLLSYKSKPVSSPFGLTYRNLESGGSPSSAEHLSLELVYSGTRKPQYSSSQRDLYITYSSWEDRRHKIRGLVKGREESGFHFTPRCFQLAALRQAANTKYKAAEAVFLSSEGQPSSRKLIAPAEARWES